MQLALKRLTLINSIAAKIAEMRAAAVPTPLATYLHILARADTECYIDYLAGARALAAYLAPLELPVSTYPEITDNSYNYTALLGGYYIQELARMLADSGYIPGCNDRNIITRAILIVTLSEVVPSINRNRNNQTGKEANTYDSL